MDTIKFGTGGWRAEIGKEFNMYNIRKVAQKYYGDIDISQEDNRFTLIIMLM